MCFYNILFIYCTKKSIWIEVYWQLNRNDWYVELIDIYSYRVKKNLIICV